LFAAHLAGALGSTVHAAGLTWTAKRVERVATTDQDSVEVGFRFKNSGPDDLTIFKIHPSCGCTTATLDKKT
jgi:hypothetical protein